MAIDIAVAIVLLIALYVGYQRGVIQPLMVEVFFMVALLIILRERVAYTAAMDKYLHANVFLDLFVALVVALVAGAIGGMIGGSIHRMPVVRGVDGLLGILVNVAFATLVMYLLISAVVVLDKAFGPTGNAPTLSLAQVNAMTSQVESNPLTASLVDTRDLAQLQKQAKTPGGAHIGSVPQLQQLYSAYFDFLQPQLKASRTAPVIVAIGSKIPVIGHVRPSDLPKK